MNKIFVYGTLKKGFRNHFVLNRFSPNLVGVGSTLKPYCFFVNERYSPFVIPEKFTCGNRKSVFVKGEVYEVCNDEMVSLKKFEKVPEIRVMENTFVKMDDNDKIEEVVMFTLRSLMPNERYIDIEKYEIDDHLEKYIPSYLSSYLSSKLK